MYVYLYTCMYIEKDGVKSKINQGIKLKFGTGHIIPLLLLLDISKMLNTTLPC